MHSACTGIAVRNAKNVIVMSKRVRISNDSLNSYGTRVLTAGMNVEQYSRNPVLLYMHERGNVIGYVKDLKVEHDEVTGELVFDEATELSKRCKKQFEFGSLKMVSAGLDIIEMSEDSAHLVAGQTSPTITKSKLFEVSVVDIGANDDALVLKKDGKRITLDRDGECPLPKLTTLKTGCAQQSEQAPLRSLAQPLSNNHQKTKNEMENKTIALQLGLPETATDAEIAEKIGALKTAGEENAKLQKENDALTLANLTSLVEKAIGEKRIGAENKQQFIDLGKKIGAEDLENVLSTMSPQVKLSAVLGPHGTAKTETATYKKLSEVPGDKLLEIREQQPDEYKRLYKAEYGMECKIED